MNKNVHILGLTGLLILLALWQIGSVILAHSMPLANMLAPAAALGSAAAGRQFMGAHWREFAARGRGIVGGSAMARIGAFVVGDQIGNVV